MRIAVVQTPGSRLDHWRQTLELIEDLVRQAAARGAQIAVLPECVWPAYDIGSCQAYAAARAAGLPSPDDFRSHLQEAARGNAIALCAGYTEEHGDHLFNAACLIDAAGNILGTHRKCFLWDFDHDYFVAGQVIEPIATPFGCVGLMICADARLPEIAATLARRGANLILQPTAWVDASGDQTLWNPQPEFLVPTRAAEFGVPIASASKWGREGNTTFVGCSLICDAHGHVLARCPKDQTAVITADVQPCTPRPPVLHADERAVLAGGPIAAGADLPPVDLVLVPPGAAVDAGSYQPDTVAGQSTSSLRLLVTLPRASDSPDGDWEDHHAGLLVSAPGEEVLDLGLVRVAAVKGADVKRFATLRRFALLGIHVAVVLGDEPSLTVVQARACENRIFVVWATTAEVRVLDPRGLVVFEAPWPPASSAELSVATTLDVRAATNKEVAPRTNVLTDRRPGQYAL